MRAHRVDVVVRCFNEMPHLTRTLSVLLQDPRLRVRLFDSGSTDGSIDEAVRAGVQIVSTRSPKYVPGKVLNDAMRKTEGEVVAFVNADAVPLSHDAVTRLVEACECGAAASFGRQVPRPDATPATRADYARAFPASREGNGLVHFYSMAASAIRRDVWEALPFDEALRFSEDVDWTQRVRVLGRAIRYVPGAVVEHSHDYDERQRWKRMFGEGEADAAIYRVGAPGVVRGFAAPLFAQLLRDAGSGVIHAGVARRRVLEQAARWRGRTVGASQRFLPGDRDQRVQDIGFTIRRETAAELAAQRSIELATAALAQKLRGRAEALLLLGGFAYGEGAVELREGRYVIHNDLDLVAVADTDAQAHRLRSECERLSRRASEVSDAVVDVWCVSRRELESTRGKLLWADAAIRGVRVVWGDASVTAPLARLSTRSVRRAEIGRLLANRGTGIALSRLAFERDGSSEGRRAARHVAKAWLALGDAVLISVDDYGARSADRIAALQRLSSVGAPWVEELASRYSDAVRYRHAPHEYVETRDGLEAAVAALWPIHAHLEAYRLGESVWKDPFAYAFARRPRFPELDDVALPGRWLAGLRALAHGVVPWRQCGVHPREVLARTAALIAYSSGLPAARQACSRLLRCSSTDPHSVAMALEAIRERGA